MPDGDGIDFDTSKGEGWDPTIAALDEVSSTLAEDIKARVENIVDPWITEAKAQVESMPIKGVGKQKGLRGNVAHNVDKTVTGDGGDFTVSVDANLPGDEGEQIIPLGLDRLTGWRHPVFGNPKVWVQQVPLTHEWFTDAFEGRSDQIENEIQDALDEAVNKIADAGE